MRFLAWILCGCAVLWAADPDARELYERARMLAEQNQQLDQAIRLFGQAVEFAGSDRALAAQAQYRQGLLYERLGRKAEAERAFDAVVRNFGGQTEVARLARARLPNREPAAGLRTRRVWAGDDVDTLGAPSPDGRLLSFVDWHTGELAVRDLTTGETRQITHHIRSAAGSAVMWSVFSPDGSQIAYDWYSDDGTVELRIVSVNGSEPRTIYKTPVGHTVRVTDWSSDGRYVAAETYNKVEQVASLLLVSVSDGSSRVLPAPDCPCGRMQFSPDSRFIAYDARAAGEERGDVYITSVYGDRVERVVSASESDDSLIGWTPDGSLLFSSDRSGSKGILSVAVRDGVATGEPKIVRANVSTGTPLGMTKDRALYYATSSGDTERDVYIAGIDLVSGRITEAPRAVSPRYIGDKGSPAWSPDGKRLAYLAGPENRLVILTLDSGSEREVTPKLVFSTRMLGWHPDGQSVLMQGMDGENRPGTFAIKAETGDATFLLNVNDRPAFSPDMRTAYHGNSSVPASGIYAQDLATGQDTLLYKPRDRAYTKNIGAAISPDGRFLAVRLEKVPPGGTSLAVLPTGGGEPRIVVPDGQISPGMNLNWTPDSRHILYSRAIGKNSELWMVPADGGTPVRLLEIAGGPPLVRLSPDGRQLAITANKSGEEIWVMENFLNP